VSTFALHALHHVLLLTWFVSWAAFAVCLLRLGRALQLGDRSRQARYAAFAALLGLLSHDAIKAATTVRGWFAESPPAPPTPDES
jgi:hypothetical protein